MIAAFVVAFCGSLLLAIVPNYLTAVLSLFLIGCGMAMLQVAINPLLRTSGGEEHYAFNSVLAQLIFGFASFLSPLVYSYIVSGFHPGVKGVIGLPWIALYWLFAVIALLMIVVIALSRFPRVELSTEEKAGPLEAHVQLLKKPAVILFFLAMICYVGSEQGVANWISQFQIGRAHV